MSGEVRFDEDSNTKRGIPQVRSRTMADMLVRWGVVRSQSQAYAVLLVATVVMLGISYYLFMYAVPPAPELGADVLRPGESVPSYVNQQRAN